jgi:hypothetical protein
MPDRRYMVGERVLVSRAETGADHEEATVVDFYELLINRESIPSVVVDFDDGQRKYLTAKEPNVMPFDEEEEPEWEDEDDEAEEDADELGDDDLDSNDDDEFAEDDE